MTSAQTMLSHARLLLLASLWLSLLAGCASPRGEVLTPPVAPVAPYDPSGGERLWAVAPLRNESGTSTVDPLAVSDALTAAVQEVRGLRALPLNRVLDAMRVLDLGVIDSPEQAQALAEALGVDALLLGSVTAWDPYDPPAIGLSLALYERPGATIGGEELDPRRLTYQPSEYTYFPRSSRAGAPASSVAQHLDASNHAVLARVRAYATGRHDPELPYGWRRYLASMDLYTRFAAHHAVGSLLARERLRLAGASDW